MNGIFKGVRPLDYVLAGVMTAAGAYLMYENMVSAYGTGLPHAQSTTTGAMLPFFVFVTVPILWRRRNILAVVGATALATLAHVLLFGWNTRCGVAFPLTFALAYAVARFAVGRKDQVIGLAGVVVVQLLVVFRDASIDLAAGGLAVGIPVAALFYGIGLVVQNRVTRKQSAALAPAVEHAAA
jgi:hypothetical protein